MPQAVQSLGNHKLLGLTIREIDDPGCYMSWVIEHHPKVEFRVRVIDEIVAEYFFELNSDDFRDQWEEDHPGERWDDPNLSDPDVERWLADKGADWLCDLFEYSLETYPVTVDRVPKRVWPKRRVVKRRK